MRLSTTPWLAECSKVAPNANVLLGRRIHVLGVRMPLVPEIFIGWQYPKLRPVACQAYGTHLILLDCLEFEHAFVNKNVSTTHVFEYQLLNLKN